MPEKYDVCRLLTGPSTATGAGERARVVVPTSGHTKKVEAQTENVTGRVLVDVEMGHGVRVVARGYHPGH